jgi:hypothetical protein
MRTKIIAFLYLLIFINILYVLSGAFHTSLQSVDALGIWLFKAKAFFVEGGFPLHTLKNPDFFLFHPQYPLLLPFLYSLVYSVLGRVWELPILLLYPLYYVGILFLVHAVLQRQGLTTLQSLVYTYIYSMFGPLLAAAGRMHAGEADILIVLFGWILVYFLQRTRPSNLSKMAALMTILIIIASQIKMEGLFLSVVLLFLPIQWHRKVVYLFIAVLPSLFWRYTLSLFAIPSDFTFVIPSLWQLGERLWFILLLSGKEMLNVNNWYIFWPLFWMSLQKEKPSFFIDALQKICLLLAVGFIAVYVSVTTDVYAHIASSIDRVLFQLTPFLYPIFVMNSMKMLRNQSRKH